MIKVAIVDDQKVVTQGLKALLDVEPDVQIIGTGSNGSEAIHLVETLSPDVLLIDQYMPVMDGITATKEICGRFPNVAVLLLSGSESDETIAQALQAGAKGYLLKSTSAEELADSIRSVHRGYSHMGPGLMEKLLAKIGVDNLKITSRESGQATLSLARSPAEELTRLLGDSTRFEADAIRRLLDSVDESSVAAELMTQIERKLQRNPNHVSALFLAGQLIREFNQNQHSRLSINYFRLAYQHAQQQNFPLAVQLQICRAAWNENSGEVFEWLKEILKIWQPTQPRREFFQGMAQVFAPSSDAYRLVKAAWEIQGFISLCHEVKQLEPSINLLMIQGKPLENKIMQSPYSYHEESEGVTVELLRETSLERN